ncbi:S-methyl-5-thioribose-1-phosphate isomerase [soil metagenome]
MEASNPTPVPPIPTIALDDDEITIIDQTLLPTEERRIIITTVEEMREAIQSLRIRGAPAIGIAAVFGLDIAARTSVALSRAELLCELKIASDYLAASRPTAVNLSWALRRVYDRVSAEQTDDVAVLVQAVRREALALLQEDLEICRRIGEHGIDLISGGSVLTHCNAGGLATSGYGTALAPMYVAHERGVPVHVYAGETRPLLQGARLTSWELARAGIDVTVIADNMAATVLSRGDVKAVIVGADRVAANGDVANKIGTLGVAILAKTFGVPFYVAVPLSTIDFDTSIGADIPIEERLDSELTSFNNRLITPVGMDVYNPAFDITPAAYVTTFITEHGVVYPPFAEGLAAFRDA